jgi:hypothetical protein
MPSTARVSASAMSLPNLRLRQIPESLILVGVACFEISRSRQPRVVPIRLIEAHDPHD